MTIDKAEVQQVEETPLPPFYGAVREAVILDKLVT